MGFEFFFYLVLLLLFPIRKFNKVVIVILFIAIAVLLYGNLMLTNELKLIPFELRVDLVFELGVFFLIGALLGNINWETLKYDEYIFYTSCALLLIIVLYKLNPIWLCLCWPFIVLYVGQKSSKFAGWIHENIEDPSFGIYLYAFPVQQLIIHFYKPSVFVLLWSSTIISFILGIASWKLLEKRILKWKNLFAFRSK
jgi:peptidoglycan/LPS O-acetylase OafA/YrhL